MSVHVAIWKKDISSRAPYRGKQNFGANYGWSENCRARKIQELLLLFALLAITSFDHWRRVQSIRYPKARLFIAIRTYVCVAGMKIRSIGCIIIIIPVSSRVNPEKNDDIDYLTTSNMWEKDKGIVYIKIQSEKIRFMFLSSENLCRSRSLGSVVCDDFQTAMKMPK